MQPTFSSDSTWARILNTVRCLEPELSDRELRQLVKEAARNAQNNTNARRKTRNPEAETQKLAKWQFEDQHHWLYAWAMLRVAAVPITKEHRLTQGRYLAALISAGLLGKQGQARTPAWLAASILDTLLRIPRKDTNEFRGIVFLRPDAGDVPEFGNNEREEDIERGGGPDGYGKIVGLCHERISELTNLEVIPGRKGKPSSIASAWPLSPEEKHRFWGSKWPLLEPALGHCHLTRKALISGHTPTHDELLHLLCTVCLSEQAEHYGWPMEVYLPEPSESGTGHGGSFSESDGRELREEFEREQQKVESAVGRLMIGVDGATPVEWKDGLRINPRRFIELMRSGTVLLWHEVETPEKVNNDGVTTEYSIGSYQYSINESTAGVTIDIQGNPAKATTSPFSWLAGHRWWRWVPVGVAAALAVVLLRPASTVLSIVPEVRQVGTSPLGAGETGRLELRIEGSTWPGSSYSIEAKEVSGETTIACSLASSRPATEGGTTLLFDCGDNWATLKPGELSITLTERRWSMMDRRSPPINVRKN